VRRASDDTVADTVIPTTLVGRIGNTSSMVIARIVHAAQGDARQTMVCGRTDLAIAAPLSRQPTASSRRVALK